MADYQSIFTGEQIDEGVQAGLDSAVGLQRVTGLLQGTDASAQAASNPFVKLGDYDSWDAANAALTALLATRETECLKYTGRLRFTVQGGNFEAYMFIRNVSTPVWVQVVSGAVAVNAAGTGLQHGEDYATFVRSCSGESISQWAASGITADDLDAVRLIAQGSGDVMPFDTGITRIVTNSVGRTWPRWTGAADSSFNGWLNDMFLSFERSPRTNGNYALRNTSNNNVGVLEIAGYPRLNAAASCIQYIRGGFVINNQPDAGGYAWSEHGITNRLAGADHEYKAFKRECRRAADGTLTIRQQWTEINMS